MASNADLIEKIEALAQKLGRDDVVTEECTNIQLGALFKVLQLEESDAAREAEKPKVKKPKGSVVAKGKSIIATKHRILGPGDSISVEDLSGGKEAFANLAKAGYIVKS